MLKRKDSKKSAFYGVAIFFILIGAAITALGAVEWAFNYFADFSFFFPRIKALIGLFIMAFGYIILELELIRTQQDK